MKIGILDKWINGLMEKWGTIFKHIHITHTKLVFPNPALAGEESTSTCHSL
jgi:hypothetical protein